MNRATTMASRFTIIAGSLIFGLTLAASPAPRSNAQQTAPDTSKATKSTAGPANSSPADRDLAKKVRSDLMKDKSLSTEAHNVKVITQDGKITLRGPVKSEDEKSAVESIAKKAAGDGDVVNELTVSRKK